MRHKFLAILVLLLVSCATEPQDYESEPNICVILSTEHGDFEPWESRATVGRTVVVGDTVPVDTIREGEYYSFPWVGISGAEVILSNNDTTVILDETSDQGYYKLYPLYNYSLFVPEAIWELEVNYPGWPELHAGTRFPEDFEITHPPGDTFFWGDSIVWSASEGAKGYGLWYTYQKSGIWWQYFTGPLESARRSKVIPPRDYDEIVFRVAALDTNLYDYLYCGWNFFEIDDPRDWMHIEGAWGVFGAQTVVSRSYVFSPQDSLAGN
ncbi:hypothetical protein GF338_06460 [candidate division WOR-3 bacterium]|nr:hypothetical protein [candidate division WOR-3 bacterium]